MGGVLLFSAIGLCGLLATLLKQSSNIFFAYLIIVYIGVLAGCWRQRRGIQTNFQTLTISPITWIFIAAVIADAAIAGVVGHPIRIDEWIHLSKIAYMERSGLSFTDPYFQSGIEVRYAFNLVHLFLMILHRTTHLDLIELWQVINPFFRIFFLLSVYATGHFICRKERVCAVAALTMLCLKGNKLQNFSLPNHAVQIWLVFWLACLWMAGRRHSLVLSILFAILIAFTHPGQALFAGILAGILWGLSILMNDKPKALFFFPSVAILLGTGLVTAVLCTGMSDETLKISIEGSKLAGQIRNILDGRDCGAIFYPVLAIGALQLSRLRLPNNVLLTAFSSIVFVPVLAKMHVIFDYVRRHVPEWLFARAFDLHERCTHLFLVVCTLYVVLYCRRRFRIAEQLIVGTLALWSLFLFPRILTRLESRVKINETIHEAREIESLFTQGPIAWIPGARLLASQTVSTAAPVFAPLRVVSPAELNISPSQPMREISAEHRQLWNARLTAEELSAASVNYVILEKRHPSEGQPFLKHLRRSNHGKFNLYSVLPVIPPAPRIAER